jgi:IS30 family transposase
MKERSLIQMQLTLGFKPSWIAEGLGRSVSTVTQELCRNGWERPVVERGRGRAPIAGKYRAVRRKRVPPRILPRPGLNAVYRLAMRFGQQLWFTCDRAIRRSRFLAHLKL